MYRIIYTLALIVILLTGCRKDDIITPPEEEEPEMKGFAIYFLEDDNLRITQIRDKPLDSLKLKKVPWIKEDDIEMFDFSGQCVYLKEDRSKHNINEFPDMFLNGLSGEKPYVVVYDDTKLFVGYLRSMYSSTIWYAPNIDETYLYFLARDILPIGFNPLTYSMYCSGRLNFGTDLNYSEEIKNKISSSKIFRKGISLQVVDVKIIRTDSIILEYSLKISNNDIDNIYIIDNKKNNTCPPPNYATSIYLPLHSNSPMKHYREYFSSNQISNENDKENIINIKQDQQFYKNLAEGWDAKWFVKLESGKSMIFKYRIEKPEDLELSKYYVRFRYYAPFPIEKSERTLSDGRYWLGTAISDITEVIVLPNDSCIITRFK